jgi:ferredoxin/flavodoxin---NADP+ reductase
MTFPLSVAIVGSGPSGAYCARLLSEHTALDARVDVYERLPAPYGLVRYGVAPDHQKIKSITASLAEIYSDPRVRFIGNVEVGPDVTVQQLRDRYDAVVLACGAGIGRRLGIAGEELPGVLSATDFVSWYSGHPDAAVDQFSLAAAAAGQAVVIGAGNVALDVARMLVRTPDELRRTDVPEHVVEVLAACAVREITIVGRRGPAFAKFTSKELMELAALESADVLVDAADLILDADQQAAVAGNPAAGRLLMRLRDLADRPARGRPRSIRFAFGCRPAEFLGAAAVEAVRFRRWSPGLEEKVDIPAQLVLRSIGYRGSALAGVPFDERTGTVPNEAGRVSTEHGPVPGLYAVGWIKRGPTGVIGTNQLDARQTVDTLVDDLVQPAAPARRAMPGDPAAQLRPAGGPVVSWAGWRAIDRAEHEHGARLRRDRVKLHDRGRLLEAAMTATANGSSTQ